MDQYGRLMGLGDAGLQVSPGTLPTRGPWEEGQCWEGGVARVVVGGFCTGGGGGGSRLVTIYSCIGLHVCAENQHQRGPPPR